MSRKTIISSIRLAFQTNWASNYNTYKKTANLYFKNFYSQQSISLLLNCFGLQTESTRTKINSKSFNSFFFEKCLSFPSNTFFEKNSSIIDKRFINNINFQFNNSFIFFLNNNISFFDKQQILRHFSAQLFCKLLVFQLANTLISSPFISLADVQNKFLLIFLRNYKKNLNIRGIKVMLSGR